MKQIPNIEGTNTREVEENWRDKYKAMEQSWMHLKDQYAEIATALGFDGDAWFGDPLADHAEIVSKARSTHHQLQKARQDWLRQEIEKLEGMYKKELEISFEEAHENHIHNQVIESIKDRYHSELDHQPDRPLNQERE